MLNYCIPAEEVRQDQKSPVNGHSCTLIPTLVALGLAPMKSTTLFKALDVLEVIGGFAMPPLLFLQLVLLIKVSQMIAWKIVHEGYT